MSINSLNLPLSSKIIFAIGAIGMQMMVAATSFFLLIFYTDVALVPPAIASFALLIDQLHAHLNQRFEHIVAIFRYKRGEKSVLTCLFLNLFSGLG